MAPTDPLDPEEFLRLCAARDGWALGQPPPPDVLARLPVIG